MHNLLLKRSKASYHRNDFFWSGVLVMRFCSQIQEGGSRHEREAPGDQSRVLHRLKLQEARGWAQFSPRRRSCVRLCPRLPPLAASSSHPAPLWSLGSVEDEKLEMEMRDMMQWMRLRLGSFIAQHLGMVVSWEWRSRATWRGWCWPMLGPIISEGSSVPRQVVDGVMMPVMGHDEHYRFGEGLDSWSRDRANWNGQSGARGGEGGSARTSLSLSHSISLCMPDLSLFHISSSLTPPRDWKWRLPPSPHNLGLRFILSTASNKSRPKQSWQIHICRISWRRNQVRQRSCWQFMESLSANSAFVASRGFECLPFIELALGYHSVTIAFLMFI